MKSEKIKVGVKCEKNSAKENTIDNILVLRNEKIQHTVMLREQKEYMKLLPVRSRIAKLFPFFRTISSWYMAGLGGRGGGSALLGLTMLMPCRKKLHKLFRPN